ncbi:hypothetical protein [Vibrio sp. J502]|uniref:hypothetical protein n=1 Tax=Vibrio sp. J502 TaxID=2978741 RepID=UPI0021BE2FFE|nr:hypothetical protein [Vibrio sp. J502]UXH29855.1 hypothetical protein N5E84_00415 [Vibrio sp. J502]
MNFSCISPWGLNYDQSDVEDNQMGIGDFIHLVGRGIYCTRSLVVYQYRLNGLLWGAQKALPQLQVASRSRCQFFHVSRLNQVTFSMKH